MSFDEDMNQWLAMTPAQRERALRGEDVADQGKATGPAMKMRNGGLVRGPGTGTSDSIKAEVPEGSYIMPADSTAKLTPELLAMITGARSTNPNETARGKPKDIPVNLSNGEYQIPPEQVRNVGAKVLDTIKDATHVPAAAQRAGGDLLLPEAMRPGGGGGARSFADGGRVESTDEMIARIQAKYGTSSSNSNQQQPAQVQRPAAPAPTPAPTLLGAVGALRNRRQQLDEAAGYADGGTVQDRAQMILRGIDFGAVPAGGVMKNGRLSFEGGGDVQDPTKPKPIPGAPGVQRVGNEYSATPKPIGQLSPTGTTFNSVNSSAPKPFKSSPASSSLSGTADSAPKPYRTTEDSGVDAATQRRNAMLIGSIPGPTGSSFGSTMSRTPTDAMSAAAPVARPPAPASYAPMTPARQAANDRARDFAAGRLSESEYAQTLRAQDVSDRRFEVSQKAVPPPPESVLELLLPKPIAGQRGQQRQSSAPAVSDTYPDETARGAAKSAMANSQALPSQVQQGGNAEARIDYAKALLPQQRDQYGDAYRNAWQQQARGGLRGADETATATYNAEQLIRGTGITAQRDASGRMSFSGDGTNALPQNYTSGVDLNLANERMARANAIRGETVALQQRLTDDANFASGVTGARKTTPEERRELAEIQTDRDRRSATYDQNRLKEEFARARFAEDGRAMENIAAQMAVVGKQQSDIREDVRKREAGADEAEYRRNQLMYGNADSLRRDEIERQSLALQEPEAEGQKLANYQTRMLQDIQRRILDPKNDDADKRAAMKSLQLLQGTGDKGEWKAVTLQGGTDAMGNRTESVLAAVNERTGEMRRYEGGGQAPAAAIAALKANPQRAAEFDQKYGQGAASRYLAS